MKNDVWEIVPRLEGKTVVTSKWIYKIKHVTDGSIDKNKTRFIARWFSKKEGEDYDETCVPISKYTSIRSIISLATSLEWNLHRMDVKISFLNGVIEDPSNGSPTRESKSYKGICPIISTKTKKNNHNKNSQVD